MSTLAIYLMLKRIEARGQVVPHKSTQTMRPSLLPTKASRLEKMRDLTRAFEGVSPVGVLPRLLITSALTLVSVESKFLRMSNQNEIFLHLAQHQWTVVFPYQGLNDPTMHHHLSTI